MNRRAVSSTLAVVLAGVLVVATPSEGKMEKSDGLTVKQQRIVPIAAFTASGDQRKLRAALADGLEAGWTINELKEIVVQMYAYAGFPRSLNALNTFIDVLDERQHKGIADAVGREPSPMPAGRSSVELGTEIQTRLVGGPAQGRYLAFSPAIDAFLKGHLFGDILGRDNLDVQSREIATISALATLEDVTPQLGSHLNVGLNVGLTEAQLRSLIAVVGENVGKKRGENAAEVLAEVVRERHAAPAPHASVPAAGGSASRPTVTVRRKDAQLVESAPAGHFTGSVHLQRLFEASDPARASSASVTFDPGARTAWHSHPLGQRLIVTAGTGWVQQWGEPAQPIRVGDVVSIPPGAKHWHGATATTAMTHIAIQEQLDGNTVQWMESVSDEQYRGAGSVLPGAERH
jgi:quercetin dioxygenase-like cupin family protein/alkylhydroperoxidase/carboxymuconolactone decarboxylase family protein YurZ